MKRQPQAPKSRPVKGFRPNLVPFVPDPFSPCSKKRYLTPFRLARSLGIEADASVPSRIRATPKSVTVGNVSVQPQFSHH